MEGDISQQIRPIGSIPYSSNTARQILNCSANFADTEVTLLSKAVKALDYNISTEALYRKGQNPQLRGSVHQAGICRGGGAGELPPHWI